MKQLGKSVVIILIGLSTLALASGNRVAALGGAKFWADDYANINAFPGAVNNFSLAWTNWDSENPDASDFNAIWDVDGTTWGFSGTSTANDVVNMRWGNGSIGVQFGLNMDGTEADASTTPPTEAGETKFNIGVGTTMGFGDVGFIYNRDGDIHLNLRRAQSLWLFSDMVVGFEMNAESTEGADDAEMNLNVDCYRMSGGENANALFAMGIAYSDATVGANEGSLNLMSTWALESTMDWATLRLGYTQGYDLMNSAGGEGSLTAGLGFMYGNWAADMVLSDGTLNGIMSNPIHYLNGRNATPLAGAFSLSYAW